MFDYFLLVVCCCVGKGGCGNLESEKLLLVLENLKGGRRGDEERSRMEV